MIIALVVLRATYLEQGGVIMSLTIEASYEYCMQNSE